MEVEASMGYLTHFLKKCKWVNKQNETFSIQVIKWSFFMVVTFNFFPPSLLPFFFPSTLTLILPVCHHMNHYLLLAHYLSFLVDCYKKKIHQSITAFWEWVMKPAGLSNSSYLTWICLRSYCSAKLKEDIHSLRIVFSLVLAGVTGHRYWFSIIHRWSNLNIRQLRKVFFLLASNYNSYICFLKQGKEISNLFPWLLFIYAWWRVAACPQESL